MTATATILNKCDTSNIMENPINYEDNDEFDYVQVDDDTMNDVSQSDIMELTEAITVVFLQQNRKNTWKCRLGRNQKII